MAKSKEEVAIKMVGMNTDKADSIGCSTGIKCNGVSCSECPLNDASVSLGDVRESLKVVEPKPVPPIIPPAPAPQDIEGVRTPSHYMLFDDIEAIEVIARSMTIEQFKGYCLGNILKYRLRAGKKSELAFLEKDLAKAEFYGELFEKHKDKCHA